MRILHFVILATAIYSCNNDVEPAKNVGNTHQKKESEVVSDSTDRSEPEWKSEKDFFSQLSSKEYSQYGDKFHGHLHVNYSYDSLLQLLEHESPMVKSYSLYALRRHHADTLYQIARLVKNDTSQVVAKWEGRYDIHINCYSISQIAAQSLIWYDVDGLDKITENQKAEMRKQMNRNLKPISDECGMMMSILREEDIVQ